MEGQRITGKSFDFSGKDCTHNMKRDHGLTEMNTE
jgi:hypothetical protein